MLKYHLLGLSRGISSADVWGNSLRIFSEIFGVVIFHGGGLCIKIVWVGVPIQDYHSLHAARL